MLLSKRKKQPVPPQPMDESKEYAKVIKWKPEFELSYPEQRVFSSSWKTILTYVAKDNTWGRGQLVLVEFDSTACKFWPADVEVFGGLPLYRRGISMNSAHVIKNSKWIQELDKVNSVHPNYRPMSKEYKHFLLLFRENVFECIAKGYKIEIFKSLEKLMQEVGKRMIAT
jgi:hypothetical protein